MRIAVLGAYAPSLVNFRGAMIADLVAGGHEVIAMAAAIDPATRGRLEALGARPVAVPIANASLNPLSMLASLSALARTFRRLRPDIVIGYTVKPVTLGALAAARAGVPAFVALVTGLGFAFIPAPGVKRRLSRLVAARLYRLAFRRSRAIIFQNPDDRADFDRLGLIPPGAKVALVNGSGVDLDHFRPAPLPAEPHFLMVSRLIGDKGVREYGAAAARLKRRHPHARFSLAGYFDGSPDALRRAELDQLTAGGIDYLGKLDDVRPAIAAASVYVLPSYREGTPRSVLEAMAMGRAVVTTDAPGCRQTVEHGVNGLLVPPRDAAALAAAMERFIVEPGLAAAMGPKSRALAEQRFDVHAVNAAIFRAAGIAP